MKQPVLITLFLWALVSSSVSAAPSLPMILEGGYKAGYSTGLLDSFWYHHLYLKGGYRGDSFSFSAVGSHYLNYHISDQTGKIKGIDATRMEGEAEVFINDKVSLSTEISGWFGQGRYRRIEGLAGVTVEKGKWSFTGEAGGGRAAYYFDSSREMTYYADLYFETARYVTDNFIVEGSYSFLYNRMKGLESVNKHLLRCGVSYMGSKKFFLFGGAAFGLDSRGFSNVGLDCGGRMYLFRYIKLSFSYMLFYGNSFVDTGDAMSPGPGSITGNEKYTSHRLLLGAALKYR